ncbi:hypothetical protein HMI54_002514 [Coelomomyces lativittatus]|nr:hypothetical protein HMI56_004495 [Coelomomyces lativittatus]KAJ1506185.1 hypothetical protein HMI55_001277 [Coelomomyces lativittatus]KAJ1509242.1 hypothetical protein HMI54_002514 [Coelomomyces lativittatus]
MSLPNFLKIYQRCQAVPIIGPFLFSQYIRIVTPYSGSIFPHVDKLEPGHCRLTIPDKKRLHNPFQSMHALALLNAGELASGLAILTYLQHEFMSEPQKKKAIVTRLRCEYFKKGRGTILAECKIQDTLRARLKEPNFQGTVTVHSEIKNSQGVTIAAAEADWVVK